MFSGGLKRVLGIAERSFLCFLSASVGNNGRVAYRQPPQNHSNSLGSEPTDIEALSRDLVLVAAQDREAFRRVYASMANKLFAICLAVTRDAAAAEDVLQETFLKIWDRASGYEPQRSRPVAWMGAIARNSAIDFHRSRVRYRHVGEEHLNLHASEAMPADDRIMAVEQEQKVWTVVCELYEGSEAELKAIFHLGLTYPEAAEQLEVPLATLKSRVRRAVLKMRRKLSDD